VDTNIAKSVPVEVGAERVTTSTTSPEEPMEIDSGMYIG